MRKKRRRIFKGKMKIKDNLVFKPNKRNCISSLLVFFDQF